MTPYYNDGQVVIYHGDALEIALDGDVMLTDPPYGIGYLTSARRLDGNARSIRNDHDTICRDQVLEAWGDKPALVFGSHKAPRPVATRQVLIWDQDGALGMGDLRIPWKPSWQEIYVIGGPWEGRRDCGSVVRCPPVQSMARRHPHEKPVPLLKSLLTKCIAGTVVDPFMGSGSTLVAAKEMGRRCVGVELEERYCEIAAKRLQQSVLPLEIA